MPQTAARPKSQPRPRTKPKQQAIDLPQETIEGTIIRPRFHNAENGYCVLLIDTGKDVFDDAPEVTVVGNMASVRTGDRYRFTGSWKNNPKFGRQLQFTEHELIMPTSREGTVAYLASVATGIGRVKAGRIVDALGEDCLAKLQESPDALAGVPGVDAEQAKEIHEALNANKVLADLTALICREGVTPGMAGRIYAKYGTESMETVKDNPYLLADEMYGVGFVKADAVARSVGIAADSPFRIEAAVKYVMKEAENDGHCYLRPRDIMARLPKALGKAHGLTPEDVAPVVAGLVERKIFHREGNFIYGVELYEAEKELAGRVRGLLTGEKHEDRELDFLISEVEKKL